MNANLQSFYLNRQEYYIYSCVLVWFFYLALSHYQLYRNGNHFSLTDDFITTMTEDEKKAAHKNEEHNQALWAHWMLWFACLMSLVQGIFLSWIRVAEPVYWFLIKREFYSWFGEPLPNAEDKSELIKRSSFELMSSQLSVDLVYTILHSITQNTVGILKSEDWLMYQSYDFLTKKVNKMDHMVVKNLQQYQVVKDVDI